MMKIQNTPSLLFVYNADSTLFSLVSDYVHKIVSPETYQCNLCKLTYGNLGMQKQWAEFLKTLPQPVKFLHRDEFQSHYPALRDTKLPALFIQGERMSLVLGAERINEAKTIEDLISIVHAALTHYGVSQYSDSQYL
jgi:hypothetical protein